MYQPPPSHLSSAELYQYHCNQVLHTLNHLLSITEASQPRPVPPPMPATPLPIPSHWRPITYQPYTLPDNYPPPLPNAESRRRKAVLTQALLHPHLHMEKWSGHAHQKLALYGDRIITTMLRKIALKYSDSRMVRQVGCC